MPESFVDSNQGDAYMVKTIIYNMCMCFDGISYMISCSMCV